MSTVHGPPTDWGGATTLLGGQSNAAADTATLNALATARTGGGKIILNRPGTYWLNRTGLGYRTDSLGRAFGYCVDLKDIRLFQCAPGVIFRLNDDQAQDSGANRGPMSLFCSEAPTDMTFLGGEFQGNTAGQTHWTGAYNTSKEKWTQLDATCGIVISGVASSYGRVVMRGMRFYDFFANPVLADGTPTYNGGQFVGENIWVGDCGEGLSADDCLSARMTDYTFVVDAGSYVASDTSTKAKMPGDGLEFARCIHAEVDGIRTWTRQLTACYGGGNITDFGGSRNIVVKNLYGRHWQCGAGGDVSLGLAPLNVRYENHQYLDIVQVAVQLEYPADYQLKNIQSAGCGHCIYATGSSAARRMFVNAENVQSYLDGDTVALRGDIRFCGEKIFSQGQGNGLVIAKSGTYLGTPYVYGDRWDLNSIAGYGMLVTGLSDGTFAPFVTLKGSYVTGGAGQSFASAGGATTNVAVTA